MMWRRLFPAVLLFACVDGFISNLLYPEVLPLLYRDFLVAFLYVVFLGSEPLGYWTGLLRERVGHAAWMFLIGFCFIALVQVFNPISADPLLGVLGLKVLLFYWPLAVIGYAYADGVDRVRRLFWAIIAFSVPLNLFGLYQFWQGPEFLVSTFGPGFERATVMAHIEDFSGESFLRIVSTFASSGQYTAFLMINNGLCNAMAFARSGRPAPLVYAPMALNFAALLATGSRGGLLLLVAQTLMFSVVYRDARRFLVLVGLAAITLYYGFAWLGEGVIARFETLRDVQMIRQRSLETTYDMVSALAAEYPLGRGLGTASQASRHLVGETNPAWQLVENYPSKLVVETGVPGALLLYSFLLALGLRWYRRWLPDVAAVAESTVAGVAAYCLTTFALSIFGTLDSSPTAIFLPALVGVAARLSTPAAGPVMSGGPVVESRALSRDSRTLPA
jgi:hypothetical protein